MPQTPRRRRAEKHWVVPSTVHVDGSDSTRCAHVTPGMRKRLVLGLTEQQGEVSLDARRKMRPRSSGVVLDRLLRAWSGET